PNVIANRYPPETMRLLRRRCAAPYYGNLRLHSGNGRYEDWDMENKDGYWYLSIRGKTMSAG
ncbi:MAG: hypothetical protein MUP03_11125, partial [Anaerolineales bacterium]|nr:hypothetical protein [Anaerolineales bacterium]